MICSDEGLTLETSVPQYVEEPNIIKQFHVFCHQRSFCQVKERSTVGKKQKLTVALLSEEAAKVTNIFTGDFFER